MTNRPRLEVFQSLWAMRLNRPDGFERPHEAHIAMIAAAGYDGVCIELDNSIDVTVARGFKPLLERHGLAASVNVLPETMAQYRDALSLAKDLNARLLNVICLITPLDVAGSIPVVREMIDLADEAGVEMHLETHRNSITCDMFSMLQILDAVPELKIAADLSHYVTAREFTLPLPPRAQQQVSLLLARAESFQGRIGSSQQIQLPLGFPRSEPWIALFKGWWEEGFRLWRARGGMVLNFLCELGPPEYAMTGADGFEMSDRWEEAKIIRGWVQEIWARLDAEAAAVP